MSQELIGVIDAMLRRSKIFGYLKLYRRKTKV